MRLYGWRNRHSLYLKIQPAFEGASNSHDVAGGRVSAHRPRSALSRQPELMKERPLEVFFA
jgi:hypothetical protein